MDEFNKKKVVVIGAGPAGLTAGAELTKTGRFNLNILEKDNQVGGLSKTITYNGCKFDIGPHHFLTHSKKVELWWKKVMEGESKENNFVQLKRFTRIYYKSHFFHYPLQALDAILGLGLIEGFLCVFSYVKIRFFPIKNVKSFQDWVTNKFGYRLFSIFFKTYSEKVWGIPCTEISSDWASERIKGFSLSKAIFYAFFGKFARKSAPRTLADIFYYPELGAGTLWQRVADNIIQDNKNSKICLNEKVIQIKHNKNSLKSILTYNLSPRVCPTKKLNEYNADFFFSTMPLRDLILSLDPLPEEFIINAAKKLSYRGLITVNFIVNKKNICPDHWLYIHEKTVRMGRVGNMNNFSLKMIDAKDHTSLSLEYFAFVDDDLWNKTDGQLLELGKVELEKIGLVEKDLILDGMILREREAYPVYDKNYKESLNIVKNYLSKFNNLYLMGRNGLHKYDGMDAVMISAFDRVETFLGNVDRENIFFAGHVKRERIKFIKLKG